MFSCEVLGKSFKTLPEVSKARIKRIKALERRVEKYKTEKNILRDQLRAKDSPKVKWYQKALRDKDNEYREIVEEAFNRGNRNKLRIQFLERENRKLIEALNANS